MTVNHGQLPQDLPGRIRDLSLLAEVCAYGRMGSDSIEPLAELTQQITLLAADAEGAVTALLARIAALEAEKGALREHKEALRDRMLARAREARQTALADQIETVPIAEFFDPRGCFVYILWGDGQRPVYVGQSTNVLSRVGNHLSNRSKRRKVTRVQLVRCTSESAMERTEANLIAHYRPQLNVIGSVPVPITTTGEAAS